MDYSDLQFHNIQLMKLVSSAEILFQHLYELVSVENKAFISQWLNFKQEYDGDSNSQFDVNENVQECPVLTKIDEVSENEKISSISSVSTLSSDSSFSPENETRDLNDAAVSENAKSFETSTLPSVENAISQFDCDLLEYMTEFKLSTDSYVSDWFKTLSFNTAEVKQYMRWLETKEYKKIWTDIYNNSHKNSEFNNRECSGNDPIMQVVRDDPERHFIPIETSNLPKKSSIDHTSLNRRNSTHYPHNVNLLYENYEYVDQHIRYLQEMRHMLMFVRQKLTAKFKKDELKSNIELKNLLKVDVAFEIIDLSVEMKNQLKLGRDIENLLTNDEVDTIIAKCLHLLSLDEIRHILITYLTNVVDMRKCSYENDREVMELDREITRLSNVELQFKNLCWTLQEHFKQKRHHLHEQFKQKRHLMACATTDESNDESITNVHSRKLLSIVAKNELLDSSQSDTKATQTAISFLPNIPEGSSKKSQKKKSSSSGLKVTRIPRKKLIIRTLKH